MSYLRKFSLSTQDKQEFKQLDSYLNEALKESGVREGMMLVYCPHTTAGITINENADPDVKTDLKRALDETFPKHDYFVHMEGNSDGHMKSSLIGASESLIIHDGKVIFGTWQSVYFTEFDGPRQRTFYVKIMEG
ncbi:MAG: secondary thiamine-phosphate synthase enzyme YjbQ [Alkalibacterium sp.]|uniref:secondary thiamine-phosphate synthase enzyme YjbQ n=1 Tax=Alkalibacterium sp. TaxID=1872447 RepID=UPI003970ECBC